MRERESRRKKQRSKTCSCDKKETRQHTEINKGQSVKMSDDQTVAAQNDDKGE